MIKIAIFGVLVSAAAFTSPAYAQVTFDMSKASCGDYQALSPGEQRDFAAWTSGWFNGKADRTEVNLQIFRNNVGSVQKWCATNKSALVMPAIELSLRDAKAGAAGPAFINMAGIACEDVVAGDPEVKFIMSAWVGGYLASKRNDAKLDVRYFLRNQKAIETACSKTKKDNFLATAQKVWR